MREGLRFVYLSRDIKSRDLTLLTDPLPFLRSHNIYRTDRCDSGTGLFVGSGSALATGGPASLIIAYGLIGIMLFCTVHALGELAVAFPVAGSFSVYSSRFIDPSWGFAMGWK